MGGGVGHGGGGGRRCKKPELLIRIVICDTCVMSSMPAYEVSFVLFCFLNTGFFLLFFLYSFHGLYNH